MGLSSALPSVTEPDHIARVTGYRNLAGFDEGTGRLAEALARAQAEFTPVNKSKTAKVRGEKNGRTYEYEYKYADLADILGMALPILAKHGIALTQPLKRKDGKLHVITRVQFKDERDEDDGIVVPEAVKCQEMGTYLTYYRRYGVSSYLGISTEEDLDGPPPETKSFTSEQPKPKKPALNISEDMVKRGYAGDPVPPETGTFVASDDDVPTNIGGKPTPQEKKEFVARLRGHIANSSQDEVKKFVGKITGSEGTANLTSQQWKEILDLLDAAAKDGKLKEVLQ